MTPELAAAFGEIERAGALDIAAADYAELFHAAIAERTDLSSRRPRRECASSVCWKRGYNP